jgi:hypothetical protein
VNSPALADPFSLGAKRGQTVLGVDPGARGALSLIGLGSGWDFIDSADMPVRDRGVTVTNNVPDGKRLSQLLAQWRPTIVVVEDVQPMPSRPEGDETEADRRDMPARGAFTFGGFCIGVVVAIEALGYDVVLVRPVAWKKAAGLAKVGSRTRSEVKGEALCRAREIWPHAPFERAKDEARAEAALIARFGLGSQMRFF